MNPLLQSLSDLLLRTGLNDGRDSDAIEQALQAVNRELQVLEFKLARTEKVKRTTGILLEETIAELEEKRKAVEESNDALRKSLRELKAAQAQLVQSEKMASLGELTAGIAHEIQNPLNFVNNFSDVNLELLIELTDELKNGNLDEVKSILNDVVANEEKIVQHGKRAGAIVKGMLQHSRASSRQKEPTDINALAGEFLKLAYHGLRAKDKTFSATTTTDFDDSVGTIEIVAQDIGRVILNLISNALYAVRDKSISASQSYEPEVTVRSKKVGDKILLSVIDNGTGVPKNIVDKIFQPFFTTKPTGEGTGLGLSLAHDIVKAHGGDLTVHSNTSEGTQFTIALPAS